MKLLAYNRGLRVDCGDDSGGEECQALHRDVVKQEDKGGCIYYWVEDTQKHFFRVQLV